MVSEAEKGSLAPRADAKKRWCSLTSFLKQSSETGDGMRYARDSLEEEGTPVMDEGDRASEGQRGRALCPCEAEHWGRRALLCGAPLTASLVGEFEPELS